MKLQNTTECGTNRRELEILIERDEFEAAVNKAFKKKVSKLVIPGFRPGKAPRSIIEKMYGKGFFYEDALNEALPEAYEKALSESGLEPVSSPEFDVKDIDENGACVTAKIYIKPDISLKAYKGLEVEVEKQEVTDAAVDHEIEHVRERNARTAEITDRPAENGDDVVFDFDGYVDGKAFEGGKSEKYPLKLGSGSFIPGFEEQIVGKNPGDEFDVDVTFPEDYHEKTLAGKPAVFKCKLHEIKKSELPEADDEFAKDVSEFDTFAEYKASVKAKLEEDAKKAQDANIDDMLMKSLSENIEGEIPEVMFESEAESCVRDYDSRLRYQGLSLEQYMQYTGQTREQLKEQFRPQAEAHVKTRLALEKIAALENLEATEDDVSAELQKIADAYKIEFEKVKESVDGSLVKKDVLCDKAMKLVRDSAKITVADKKDTEKKEKKKKTSAKKKADAGEAESAEEKAE